MILHAARYGAREIIVGLGGSATNDGGFGMARALGYRFFAVDDTQLRIAVSKLDKLKVIERPRHLKLPAIVAATDVQNPLLGKNGSSEIYGPQKGADNAAIKVLECALKKFAGVAAKEFGVDYRDRPGAGAAGGLGFGLMMFAGALVRPGFDIVSEIVGLESKIRNADVVITGEGRLDKQTLEGKTPAGVARLARKLGKRIFAIVGEATEDIGAGKLFDGVYEVRQAGVTQAQSIETASDLLRKRGQELARLLDGGTAAG
jgi:glycerate kinase